MHDMVSSTSSTVDTREPSLAERVRRALGIAPGRPDPASGLRLALCFAAPIALGQALGETLSGLFVGIGAFMVSNADLDGLAAALRRLGAGAAQPVDAVSVG